MESISGRGRETVSEASFRTPSGNRSLLPPFWITVALFLSIIRFRDIKSWTSGVGRTSGKKLFFHSDLIGLSKAKFLWYLKFPSLSRQDDIVIYVLWIMRLMRRSWGRKGFRMIWICLSRIWNARWRMVTGPFIYWQWEQNQNKWVSGTPWRA